MDNKQFPKYQYSYFLDNGAQVVVRVDSQVELKNAVNKVIEEYPPRGQKVEEPDWIKEEPTENKREPIRNDCSHPDYWVREVKKEGANKGRHFKVCKNKDCKKFLEFTTEPLSFTG